MKKFVVLVENAAQYSALKKWAQETGSRKLPEKQPYPSDTAISFKDGKFSQYGESTDFKEDDGPHVAFSVFAAIQGIEVGPAPETHALTGQYNAVFDFQAQTMTVGCQVLPFKLVREMAAITTKHESPEDTYQQTLFALQNIGSGSTTALATGLHNGGYKIVKK